MNKPLVSIIAAIGAKNEIGQEGKQIWNLKADLARFQEKTFGKPVIMGHKTYDAIGKLLPDRTSFIVSHDTSLSIPGAIICASVEEALGEAKKIENDEIFVIGGGEIYKQAISIADKLYLTKINSEAPMADVFFPDYSLFKRVVSSEKNIEDSIEYEFIELVK